MNAIQKSILILAPLAPYLANLPVPEDSASHWSIGFGVGIGQMADVSRTCEGDVISVTNYQYSDVAAGVRYTNETFVASVTGGTSTAWTGYPPYDPARSATGAWQREQTAVPYCVPMVGFDTKYIGLEAGWFTTLGEGAGLSLGHSFEKGHFPAGALRLGNRDKLNVSVGLARNLPLIAGGGLMDLGITAPVGEKGSRVFFGLGTVPYDGPIWSVKADLKISDRFTFAPRLGLKWGDAFEYGLAIGGRARF